MFSGNSAPQFAWGGKNEYLEFLKAWLGTALVFAVVFARSPDIRATISLVELGIIMAIAAGAGVVFHELAHRIAARRFGSTAHFMANDGMLAISIVLALVSGFIILAPGAVWHRALPTRQTGIIAAAGPLTNMVLAALFLFIGVPLANMLGWFFLYLLCYFGYTINAWLGIFNMLPLGPIDGAKILNWDRVVYVGIAAFGGLMFVVQYLPVFEDILAFGF